MVPAQVIATSFPNATPRCYTPCHERVTAPGRTCPTGYNAAGPHPFSRRLAMRRTLSLIPLLPLAGSALAADPPLVVKPDAFETLVNPNCSHCRDEAKRRAGELRDD